MRQCVACQGRNRGGVLRILRGLAAACPAIESEACCQELYRRSLHVTLPPSAMPCPTPRELVSRTAAHSATNVLIWMALVLSHPRHSSASATPGDTVIRARLPPPARGAWASDYLCTAVALPADPLKLVKVAPAAVGSATDMLLYGARHSGTTAQFLPAKSHVVSVVGAAMLLKSIVAK